MLASVVVAGAYVLGMLLFWPYWELVELDADEGNTVMRAWMMARGYGLYTDIWSDQPPLMSYLPMWWCELVGWRVENVRVLVLLLAGLLVFGACDLVRVTHGAAAGLGTAMLLAASLYFKRLSASAMIGLPAIALAVLGIWAVARSDRGRHAAWLVAGGVFMALSLTTKLFTGFLAPLIVIWLAAQARGDAPGRSSLARALRPVLIWGLIAGLGSGVVLLATIGRADPGQLTQAHVRHQGESPEFSGMDLITHAMRADWPLVVLAAVGMLAALRRRDWSTTIVILWLLTALVLLRLHSPVWYHHYLLVSVPLCLLGGVAIGHLVSPRADPAAVQRPHYKRHALRMVTAAALVALPLTLVWGEREELAPQGGVDDEHHRFVIDIMRHFSDQTQLVLTDRQVYAAHTGLPVPPELCVTSYKRFAAGLLTMADVAAVAARTRPEQIVLARGMLQEAAELMPAVQAAAGPYELIYYRRNFVAMYVQSRLARNSLEFIESFTEKYPRLGAIQDFLGVSYAQRGELKAARMALAKALALDSADPEAARHLADLFMSAGDYARGFAVLDTTLARTSGVRFQTLGRTVAWRRATCPDETYRDGRVAEELINRVIQAEGVERPADVEIRAAALAAQGRYAEATTTLGPLHERLLEDGMPGLAARMASQLALYHDERPLLIQPDTPEF